MKTSELEKELLQQIINKKLPWPVREYRFHAIRRWRFDFAYPAIKLAIECEGGIWARGRHTRGGGFVDDCDKYNSAALDGWVVLRYTDRHVRDESAVKQIEYMIKKLRQESRLK